MWLCQNITRLDTKLRNYQLFKNLIYTQLQSITSVQFLSHWTADKIFFQRHIKKTAAVQKQKNFALPPPKKKDTPSTNVTHCVLTAPVTVSTQLFTLRPS